MIMVMEKLSMLIKTKKPVRIKGMAGQIKSKLGLLVLLLAILACPATALSQQASQISQFGITWYFDKEYTVGQFANGDYWVQGPVTITSIYPASVSGDWVRNGSMLNPDPQNNNQGYDSSMTSWHSTANPYDSSLNVALDVTIANPLIIQANNSLVSTISVSQQCQNPQIDVAAVLTILEQPALEGSFRPSYSGTSKTIQFNKSQLNYSLLKNLTPTASAPALSDVEADFEKPWIDHKSGWTGRDQHPAQNMPDYGREISTQIGVAALTLNLNYTNQQKEKLLIRYIQLGIDFYGIATNGGHDNWAADGGHASGRKWPILFAGLMLDDNNMKTIGNQNISFGEDHQTFYVDQNTVDITNSSTWLPDERSGTPIAYTTNDIGLPEWGIRHRYYPTADNNAWYANYRRCCTANAWAGFVLAARAMNVKDLWNHDALFDYMDRYMAEELVYEGNTWLRQQSEFARDMWDVYRRNYGAIWPETAETTIVEPNDTTIVEPNEPTTDISDTDTNSISYIQMQIVPIDSVTATEGDNITFDVAITDAPEDTDTIVTIANLPEGASFDYPTFSWTPSAGQAGVYFPIITATSTDQTANQFVGIAVEEKPEWHTPEIGLIENTTIEQAQKITVNVAAIDPDNDQLVYTVIEKPTTAILHDKAFIWVPDYKTTGTYTFKVKVSDDKYEQTTSFNVTVNEAKQDWTGRRMIYYWEAALSLLGEI